MDRTCRVEESRLAAHTAVKQEALDQPLGHRRRSLQSLIADRFENGGKPHYGALEDPVHAFEEARMANGEATNGVHCDCDLLFGVGMLTALVRATGICRQC